MYPRDPTVPEDTRALFSILPNRPPRIGRLFQRGDSCFAKAKPDLKDPQSATLTTWKYCEPWHLTKIEIRAQNSFGAFDKVYATCHRNGSVEVTDSKDSWDIITAE